MAVGGAILFNQNRLVRPDSGLQEAPIRGGIDEDIVEYRIRVRHIRIGHADSGGEKNPLAIVFRQYEFALRRVLLGCTAGGEKEG